MKTLVTVLGMFAISMTASATSVKRYHDSDLTVLKTEHAGMEKSPGAHVRIDYAKQEITLTVYPYITCPKGMFCIAGFAPEIITLPIVDMKTYRNGEFVIEAEHDQRPVDGALSVIKVSSNKKTTRVLYRTAFIERMQGKEVIKRTYFKGAELK